MSKNFIQIKPSKLADQVATELQRRITTGLYKTGEKIPTEPELMEQLGVGRSSIREAIKTLSNAGILKVQQGLGTFVSSEKAISEPLDQRLRRSELKDISEVRSILEVSIIKKAAKFRTEENLKEMQKCLLQRLQAIEANDPKKCVDVDIAFHMEIANACNNPVLTDLYKAFALVLKESFVQHFTTAEAYKRSHAQHEAVYKAIADGNGDTAASIILEILAKDS